LKPDETASPSKLPGDPAPGYAELVARARARDTGAVRLLVERHQDRAYGLALRMLRSPEDAREVAQDAFVKAWLALPGFRGESSFGTWLHRIVARRAIDRAAVLRRRRGRETGVEAAETLAAAPPGTIDAASALRLERLIANLGEAQRAVVTLFYYEGRSVEQVADMLGMPAGTVKTHLSRARAGLRGAWLREERE
jgi:RNA polymerase sigma-70 factor (ECF subfamily)